MLRAMLKPFLKRFIGLFISMVFVSMLSIGLLIAFASTIFNLRATFNTYLHDYGNVSVVADVDFSFQSDYEDLSAVEGVESFQHRLQLNLYLQKKDNRTIVARIATFKENGSSLFKRYVLESCEKNKDLINISVVRKFAANNGFKVGDTVKIGYFDIFVDCFINEIIETPEAIQARVNNYVWSDNTDFGYVYLGENELNKAVKTLAKSIEQKINADPDFAELYNEVVTAVGATFPDLVNQIVDEDADYTASFTNQILIHGADGFAEEEVAFNVKKFLDGKGKTGSTATENHNMFYYQYIEHALKQLQVAAIFVPVFFYAVTMVVIGLFINQIIKAMTSQIGIMTSVGVGKWDIISIFLVYTLLMSIVAGILGAGIGVLLNGMLAKTMITVYSIPTIPFAIIPSVAVCSILALALFAIIATLISCRQIFKITPKDATISNEAKRRQLSPKLERFIAKAPMTIKLGVNSIAQNPRRFFVSVFSIFAAFVIILLSLFFNGAKNELMHQTVDSRLSFDAQVYMNSVADDALINDVKSQPFVKDMIDCYYTYVEVSNISGDHHTYLECLAYDETVDNNLVVIPNESGSGSLKIQEKGLILPKSIANKLGAKKGDLIKINGVPVRVSDLSFQYFHPMTYMSKTQFEKFATKYVSSFLVDIKDGSTEGLTNEDAFLKYMSQNMSVTVFTKSLSKDTHGVFDSINIFIYLMIGFSLGMAFIILVIMSQNALMEQQRPISVFRAIGFSITDISNLWTLQSISQLILSAIFAIPIGAVSAIILFKLCSSATQVYPFVFSFPTVLFALGFVLLIIVASHIISMLSIKRWNLANNTRTRE